MKVLIIIFLITVITVTECKIEIREDKSLEGAVSQVGDQNENDEILVTAEQGIFLPRFATRRLAARRRAAQEAQRRDYKIKKAQRRKSGSHNYYRPPYYRNDRHDFYRRRPEWYPVLG